MFLVNVRTLAIEEFQGDQIPRYAILSHRWGQEEPSFQHMHDGSATDMLGYIKLKRTCAQARRDEIPYVWIDTCCINKTSSAELSEAINSMFRWYQQAAICYVFLSDVTGLHDFEKSQWFTRGWTLQELIAPSSNMKFFDNAWQELGTKHSLKEELSSVTRIPVDILEGGDFTVLTVAQRMSWSARRETTRREDLAYSLLGLFSIHMPLIYGEGGERAFIRLQEEIIRQSDDQSIFAWYYTGQASVGLLAPSPRRFLHCANFVRSPDPVSRLPFTITNKGLSIELRMMRWALGVYLAVLDCEVHEPAEYGNESLQGVIGIFLKPLEEPGQYARITWEGRGKAILHTKASLSMSSETVVIPRNLRAAIQPTSLYVRQTPLDQSHVPQRTYGFWVRKIAPYRNHKHFDPIKAMTVKSWNNWCSRERLVTVPEGHGGAVCVIMVKPEVEMTRMRKMLKPFEKLRQQKGSAFLLKLGFTHDFGPICYFQRHPSDRDFFWVLGLSTPMLLSRTDWDSHDSCLHMGDSSTELRVQDGGHHVFIKKLQVRGKEIWVVDILFVPRDFVCDECHKSKDPNDTRFCCLVCDSFTCCVQCWSMIDHAHQKYEAGELEHRFRAVSYQGGVEYETISSFFKYFGNTSRLEIEESENVRVP